MKRPALLQATGAVSAFATLLILFLSITDAAF